MGNNVVKLKHYEPITAAGVHFRLVCTSGDMAGQSFLLKGNRIVLGRSEKADIQILDIKLSREHAEIVQLGDYCVVTDLNSVNGILVNQKKVKQKNLLHGDQILIGKTLFEYQVEQGEPQSTSLATKTPASKTEKSRSVRKDLGKKKKKASPLVVIVMIGAAAYFVLGTDSEAPSKKEKEEAVDEFDLRIRQKTQLSGDEQTSEKVKEVIKRAIREAREGNYYRAMSELELADTISEQNSTVDAYRRMIREKRDRVIEEYIKTAKRDQNALKLESAVSSNCSILRMLYNEGPSDSRYKEAKERIKELEVMLGRNEGETDCLSE